MFGKQAVIAGFAGAALVVSTVAVAYADAGSGFTTLLIGRGQSAHSFEIQQRKGNDVVTVQNTEKPGGSSGWHSHPGTAVIVIQSGTFTVYSEPVGGGVCSVHTYGAGQVYLEQPEDEQNAVNPGTVDVVVAVTFFNVPHGESARIERTNPGDCGPS